MDFIKLSEDYSTLRKKKDELKALLAAVEERLQQTERELIDAMLDAELQNFKREDGTQFIVVTKQYPAAIPETKQELYQVLKEQGYEDLFSINTQTLASSVKQWREEAEYDNGTRGLVKLIDPYIKTEERLSISMRKAKN